MKKNKKLIPIIGVVFIFLLGAIGLSNSSKEEETIESVIPEIVVNTERSLPEDNGKPEEDFSEVKAIEPVENAENDENVEDEEIERLIPEETETAQEATKEAPQTAKSDMPEATAVKAEEPTAQQEAEALQAELLAQQQAAALAAQEALLAQQAQEALLAQQQAEQATQQAPLTFQVQGENRTISLTPDTTVWLSATGSKIHSRNDCGNMNPDNARKTTAGSVTGMEACKNCW